MTNSTMYGFHFRGNSGKVDSLGFLKVTEDDGRPQIIADQCLDRPIKGVSPILIGRQRSPIRGQSKYIFDEKKNTVSGSPSMQKWEMDPSKADKDQCWVCESWVESAFNVNLAKVPGLNFEPPTDPKEPVKVYLHCDFDDFQPDLMKDLHLGGGEPMLGKFQIYRMLPQSKILYFYSYKGIPFVNAD